MTVNLILWSVALLGTMVIVAIDLRRKGGTWSSRMYLVVDALLMIGVGLSSLYGLQLPEEAPRLHYILQGLLPLLLCVFGGFLAARWFVTGWRTAAEGAWHSPSGAIALALALGLVLATGGEAGIAMDSGAVITLVLAWLLAQRLGDCGLQSMRFGAALCLLWAGAFLVYLMIFPAQVVVEAVVEEGAATASAAPGESLLWVVPLVFLTAFLLGFFKRQRG